MFLNGALINNIVIDTSAAATDMHRASKVEPQYEIKSNKSDHIAMHKGEALNKVKG